MNSLMKEMLLPFWAQLRFIPLTQAMIIIVVAIIVIIGNRNVASY